VCSEQLVLPAGEVGQCSQVRDTYYLVTFNVYGLQGIEFIVSIDGVQSFESATNGESIWFPSGSTVKFVLPPNISGPRPLAPDLDDQSVVETVIASPLTVAASRSAIILTGDSSNLTGSDMQVYANGLMLLSLPVMVASALIIAFRRSRFFRASRSIATLKPPSVRLLSLESYLNAISKGKKKLRLWLS
jgi:hypothetical protein